MTKLQQDTSSLPARELVPLLRTVKARSAETSSAISALLAWDLQVDRESSAAAIYELWVLKLLPKAYDPRVPEAVRATFGQQDIQQAIRWLKAPDAAYGNNADARTVAREAILLNALEEALATLQKQLGPDPAKWKWGDLHTADFVHPLATTEETRKVFAVDRVRRGGDGYTVMATSNPSANNTKQLSGASFMFVFDVGSWDDSRGLSVPGNSAQPGSAHYADLVPNWSEGNYFPLAFSRAQVERHLESRLVLQPLREIATTATR